MRALDNRFDVDTIRAAKRNMRKRHQTGRVVDGFQNVFQPYGDSIIGADRFDSGARARLRVPDVLHRRKIKCRGNDLVPLIAREIKTGSDARKGDGRVRLNLDGAGVTAEKFRPHVILLDMHLRDIDGKEVAAQVKKNPDLQLTKVIAMSGKMTEDELKGLLPQGFDGFLKKPFHVRQVIECIEDATAVVY